MCVRSGRHDCGGGNDGGLLVTWTSVPALEVHRVLSAKCERQDIRAHYPRPKSQMSNEEVRSTLSLSPVSFSTRTHELAKRCGTLRAHIIMNSSPNDHLAAALAVNLTVIGSCSRQQTFFFDGFGVVKAMAPQSERPSDGHDQSDSWSSSEAIAHIVKTNDDIIGSRRHNGDIANEAIAHNGDIDAIEF